MLHLAPTWHVRVLQPATPSPRDRIRELRKQNTLGGLKTKDLIHEGHKY